MAQADKHSVEYATILDKDTIHTVLCQAKDTPFGSGALNDLVGCDGSPRKPMPYLQVIVLNTWVFL
jgi:hypothetical protein